MKVVNKKIMIVITLLVIEIVSVFLMCKSYAYKEVDKVAEDKINKSIFAMYIENEDTGEYDEVTDTEYFPSGYKINIGKSSCVDGKGKVIEDLLILKNDKITVTSNKTVFCYIYFDINKSVYQKVKSDYQNSNGAALLSETESDDYPVYYYTGDITNNNIMYGGFCWKMVRTTETGGVKLIYNGKPQTTDEGISCNNTGEDATIGKSAYNSQSGSLAYVGYMYNSNNVYFDGKENLASGTTTQVGNWKITVNYYFGDTATWDGNKYVLSNSDGSDVTTYTWVDNYSDLIGYYTCLSTTSTSCENVYYVINPSDTNLGGVYLKNGQKIDDKMRFSTEVMDNGDGTHTLVNPVGVTRSEYYANPTAYGKYYYCNDLLTEMCVSDDLRYSSSSNREWIYGYKLENIKYGNSFKYENGKYTLVDTIDFWNLDENYNKINNHHYTCFNESGECEQVKYIYYRHSTTLFYITLSDGKSVEDAIHEMLYSEDVNQTNSTIKSFIDTWYVENIKEKKDENNNLFSLYLENTMWCGNRMARDLGTWDSNGNISSSIYFDVNVLNCSNKLDQYTLKVEAGGVEGYGNNALDYPIALLNYKEAALITSKAGISTTLISPGFYAGKWSGGSGRITYITNNGIYGNNSAYNISMNENRPVSPSVSLGLNVDIIDGDGSYTNPYQIELNND